MTRISNHVTSAVIQAVVFLLVLVLGYIAAELYWTEGITATTVSAISTVVLVLITAWYARSTHRMLNATNLQTKATRAAYAPNLDVKIVDWIEDGFILNICNRGLGTAKDVRIEVSLFDSEDGAYGAGEAYRYIGYIQQSIPPEKSLVSPPEERLFEVYPRFFTSLVDVKLSDFHKVTKNNQDGSGLAKIDGNNSINYLIDRIYRGKGGNEYFPSECMEFDEIIQDIGGRSNDAIYPIVHVDVYYKDIIGDKQYDEKVADGIRIQLERDDIDTEVDDIKFITLATGFRLSLSRRMIDFAIERISVRDVAHPFEEDLSGEVIPSAS